MKCIINVMCTNHPETFPFTFPLMEKLSFTKLVPGTKKVGDCCSKRAQYISRYAVYVPVTIFLVGDQGRGNQGEQEGLKRLPKGVVMKKQKGFEKHSCFCAEFLFGIFLNSPLCVLFRKRLGSYGCTACLAASMCLPENCQTHSHGWHVQIRRSLLVSPFHRRGN